MKRSKYFLIVSLILTISIISAAEHYMIICHEDLYSASWYNKLYNLKVNQGYSVSYIEIEDGHDVGAIQFVIEEFEPDYVLLVGDASEYPDGSKQIAMASNGNYIPFHYDLMYDPFHGPSDSPIPTDEWFVENSPGVYIGRIPANTAQEVENWVDKLVEDVHGYSEYEIWKSNILFSTGNMDHPSNGCRGIYRNMERDTLITRYIQGTNLAYTTLNSADFSDPYGYSDARSEAFEDAVNAGAGFINAFGVGADETFLVNFYYSGSDWNFTNAGQYPFLNGMSCYVGRIQDYNNNQNTESIIQRLMFLDNAGIVNCIAPTWGTGTYGVRIFDEIAFEKFFNSGYQNLGKALTEIKSDFVAACSRYDWMSKSIVLYGDPTAMLPVYQYKSGNITQNTQWCGSIVVENNISVSSGVTLTIQPGTGIFFKDGKFLEVNGTLIAKGTASYPIVFSSASENPSPGDWDGIRFENSSVDAACILKYCEIEYADYGVYAYYANPTVHSCWIHDNLYGLRGYRSSMIVRNNKIYNNNQDGGYFYGWSPKFYTNTIYDNADNGLEFYYSSGKIGYTSGTSQGKNEIRNNGSWGIYAKELTEIFMGSSDSEGNRIGGYNAVMNNVINEVCSYDAHVEAEYNYWGTSSPTVNLFTLVYGGTIDFIPYLPSDPSGGSNLQKSVGLSGSDNLANQSDNRWAGYNPSKLNLDKLSDLWLYGLELSLHNCPKQAIQIYKMLIEKFPESKEARKAMVKIHHLLRETDEKSQENYFENLLREKEGLKEEYKSTALSLAAHTYLDMDQLDRGIRTFEKVLQEYPDSSSAIDAFFGLTMLHLNSVKDSSSAEAYLEILKQKYPYEERTLIARTDMGEEVDWSVLNGKRLPKPKAETVGIPTEFALHNNYPNPFNPMTNIRFDLPEAAHVSITIYDVSGREVIRLVNQNMNIGYHRIAWDATDKYGRNVASGLYIFRMRTSNGFNQTNKMMLMR